MKNPEGTEGAKKNGESNSITNITKTTKKDATKRQDRQGSSGLNHKGRGPENDLGFVAGAVGADGRLGETTASPNAATRRRYFISSWRLEQMR